MIDGAVILVVEDEILIALHIASAIKDAGGRVLGPATTTVEALALIDGALANDIPLAAAVLDINLADRDVTPVALRLLDLEVPFVVHSATGPAPALSAVVRDIAWLVKPSASHKLVRAIARQIAYAPAARPAAVTG